jgi:hypothetical protein
MATTQYWLAQWLDANEVHNDWEIEHALRSKTGRQSLHAALHLAGHRMFECPNPEPLNVGQSNEAIVAGRRLDLSGAVSCFAFDCLRRAVDSTFKRIWHYFDQIVVEGLSPLSVMESLNTLDEDDHYWIFAKIYNHARLFLYLREIGAEPFVIFSDKTFKFCQQHWEEYAKHLGITLPTESQLGKVIGKVVDSSNFKINQTADSWQASVTGEYFDEPFEGNFAMAPTPEFLARLIVSNFSSARILDVGLARRLSLPLVEPMTTPWISQRKSSRTPPEEWEVGIELNLPVFNSLTTKDFLQLRKDEQLNFEIFRGALRTMIRNQLNKNQKGPPGEVAGIIEENLQQELRVIKKKVHNNRMALVKKTAVNLSIGTVATSIGDLASIPLWIAGGIATLGSAIPLAPAIHKYIDDNNSAKMPDLYFLWQADKKSRHR